jgi:DNA-binding NarL/FixJ family response regulator
VGFRESCLKLGCKVVAETGSGAEAIELVEHYRPDLLILDQYLQDEIDGHRVQQEIRRQRLKTKVLVITSYCDSASFFNWIGSADGPDGVLSKSANLYHIRAAIIQLLTTEERYIPDSIWNQERRAAGNPLRKLAPHEMRVLRAVAQGYRLIDIARQQHLAASTIRSYITIFTASLTCQPIPLHLHFLPFVPGRLRSRSTS